MLKASGRTAACGALFALAACSGGGDGDSGAVPLQTKADALREFWLAGSIGRVQEGTGAAASGGIAPKAAVRAGWRNPLPDRTATPRAKAASTCPGGGQSETVSGSASYGFGFFNEVADVEFERTVDVQCIEPSEFEGGTELYTYDGVIEEGSTGDRGDGSSLNYEREGTAERPYVLRYDERRDGTSVYHETEKLKGEAQTQLTNTFGQLGVLYHYEYSNSLGDALTATLGESGQPFHIFADPSGAQVNGRYSYRSPRAGCSGGAVDVATLSPVTAGDSGLDGGQVRIRSGGHTAVLTLNQDGSAVLELNGTTMPVTAGELAAGDDDADRCIVGEAP